MSVYLFATVYASLLETECTMHGVPFLPPSGKVPGVCHLCPNTVVPRMLRCLLLLPCIHALQLSGAPRTLTTRPRVGGVRLAAPPPEEPKGSSLPSDEDLMASFNKRLEAEGGATKFRLKTDASSALDEVKGVGDGIKSSVGKLFDAGSSRPASDGLMAQDQWKTLVIFFGLTIALSLGSALVSQTGGGEKTSDGAPLEFGSREPYRPQLGQ